MAKYNEILVGRYTRFLQKFLSMKGEAPAPQLASEIAATWSLFHGAENRYLENWNRFALLFGPGAGGAGNRSGVRLRNNVSANIIVVIEKVTFDVGAALVPQITIGKATTDLATLALPARAVDLRSAQGSSLITSTQNGGALAALTNPVVIWQQNCTAAVQTPIDVIVTDIQEFPLAPGDALQIDAGIDNTTLTVMIWWRERLLEESERQ